MSRVPKITLAPSFLLSTFAALAMRTGTYRLVSWCPLTVAEHAIPDR